MSIPKKIQSFYEPIKVRVLSGTYLIVVGSADQDGWYPVKDDFDIDKVRKNWSKLLPKGTEQVKAINEVTYKAENSKKNGFYTVTYSKGAWNCDCAGFGFRRKCRHIDEAKVKQN